MRRWAFILLGCLMISSAKAEITVTLQGQLGGQCTTVDVSADGTRACAGVGSRVVILDLSELGDIREVGKSRVLPEIVEHVAVADKYAFVADGLAGLYVLDVSDPAAPAVVGHYETPSGPLWFRGLRGLHVGLAGRQAYLCDGDGGLHILDVSNPAEPACIALLEDVHACDVEVVDGYAYVGTSNQGLLVLDVSDPAHPTTAAQFEASYYFPQIEAAGGYVYATCEEDAPEYAWGLFVVDVRDPRKPVLAGRCDLDHPGGLAIDAKIAYVTNGWREVEFIRITNPAIPARIGVYKSSGFSEAITARAGRIYIAASHSGLEVVDVSNPARPVAQGTYATREAADVAVSDDYAYVVSPYTGLQIIDVSDPHAPAWVNELDFHSAGCLSLGKGCIWVGDGDQFTAIDVSNPLKPKVTGACKTKGAIDDIAVEGSYAYAAAGGGLTVLDVSNPYRPAVVGRCELSVVASAVGISGRYAYVGDIDGLDILDVSDPAAPSRMGRYAEPQDWPFDIALRGDYAYLAHGNAGMRVIDISDPWLPGRVRQVDTDYARAIAIQGPYGYLADMRLGLQVFDVSSPASLRRLGGYGNAGFNRIAVSGDYVYAADWSGGLVILEIEQPSDTREEISSPTGEGSTTSGKALDP